MNSACCRAGATGRCAVGKRATMLAKISSDMPLPMPRWVMSSPIHMMSAVPAISVITMTASVKLEVAARIATAGELPPGTP